MLRFATSLAPLIRLLGFYRRRAVANEAAMIAAGMTGEFRAGPAP